MIKRLLLFILVVCPAYLFAQVSDIVFIGTVTTADGQNFSYKLQFTDANGQIKGYSVTDIMGPNETKTEVTGTINSSQKQIKFRETRVLRSKVGAGSTLCFMSATLKASSRKGTTILKGTFKGYTDKNAECSSGKIVLVAAKDVMDKLMKSNFRNDSALIGKALAADRTEVLPAANEKKETPPDPVKLSPGTTNNITVAATTATISVWDASNVDGDMITVLHNGKLVLSSYTLSATPKDFTITLTGNDEIQVVANNEGSEPMNTARMKIVAGNDVRYFDAGTTVDKPVSIILKR